MARTQEATVWLHADCRSCANACKAIKSSASPLQRGPTVVANKPIRRVPKDSGTCVARVAIASSEMPLQYEKSKLRNCNVRGKFLANLEKPTLVKSWPPVKSNVSASSPRGKP